MSDKCKDCGATVPFDGCRRSSSDCAKERWPTGTYERLQKVLQEARARGENEEDVLMMLNDMIC